MLQPRHRTREQEGDRADDGADPDTPRRTGRERSKLEPRAVQICDDQARVANDRLAIRVGLHAARSAVKQGKADGALQILQQLGRGRLGNAKLGRRLAQAFRLRQRNQEQELAALEPLQHG